jgi:zinc transport system substrate-binding protein
MKSDKVKYTFFVLVLMLAVALAVVSCEKSGSKQSGTSKISVVTTLFPLYDFAKQIGGEKAQVMLLLPPGVEPHHFDPKPRDILSVNKADVFVYTGKFMEPWAEGVIKGISNKTVIVVDSSKATNLLQRNEGSEDHHEDIHGKTDAHHESAIDPHIWLDLANAQTMVDNILEGFVAKDPANKVFYEANATAYKSKLNRLDEQFKSGLTRCETRLFVHGGHYAFSYLAHRYSLEYVSAYGISPNAEPSPRHLARIIDTVKKSKVNSIFFEELLQPRVATTISQETGARLLSLNGGHNVTKDDLEKGITFISILEHDLENLRKGLQCR